MPSRPLRVALPVAALVLAGTLNGVAGVATAVGPFNPAETVIAGCSDGVDGNGDAAIAVDGTTRGFANCTGALEDPIRFYRDTLASAPTAQPTPYTGQVLATAWDGQDATYVVIIQGSMLKIGKRVESTGPTRR